MPKPPSLKPGSLSRYQTFETATVHRRQLRGAPYNPRRIDEHAKAKLRANLKRVGLIQPLIWNKRTGNLVGGESDEPASAVLTEVEAAAAAKKAERLAAHKAARTVPAIKDRRREYKAADQENHDSEFYAVVVFENRDAREAFMARMGVDPADRYVDGARVTANLAPPAGPPA